MGRVGVPIRIPRRNVNTTSQQGEWGTGGSAGHGGSQSSSTPPSSVSSVGVPSSFLSRATAGSGTERMSAEEGKADAGALRIGAGAGHRGRGGGAVLGNGDSSASLGSGFASAGISTSTFYASRHVSDHERTKPAHTSSTPHAGASVRDAQAEGGVPPTRSSDSAAVGPSSVGSSIGPALLRAVCGEGAVERAMATIRMIDEAGVPWGERPAPV